MIQLLHTIGLVIITSSLVRGLQELIDKVTHKKKIKYKIEALIILGIIFVFWLRYYLITYLGA